MYSPSVKVFFFKLIYLREEIDSNTVVLEGFNTLLPIINRSPRQKISKEIANLRNSLDQMEFN